MLKRTTNHTIFEVYNEWAAESVYIDHRPSWDEIVFLVHKEWKDSLRLSGKTEEVFIKKHIFVEIERRMYTTEK